MWATLRLVPVVLTNVTTLLVGFSMFGIFVLLPELAQAPKSTGYGFGVSATHAGLLLTPGALIMMGAGPLAGVVGVRWGNRLALSIGGFAAAAGLLAMTLAHATQAEIVVLQPAAVRRHRHGLRRHAQLGHRRGARRQDR